jgi:GAF domain-containing protein
VDHDLKQVSAQAVAGDNYDPETLRYEDLNSGISGLVFRSGQPVLSLSADDGIEPAETAERRRQNGTGALIVAPLVAQGQVIGTVTASNLVGQRLFTRQDVDLFMTLAAQSVSVIERLHLFEQAQRALSDLDTINRQLTGAGWEKFARRRSQSNYIWVTRSDQLQPSGVVGPSGAVGPQPLSEVTEALALGHIATRLLDDGEQLGVAVPIKLRDVPIGTLRLIVPLQSWTAELSASLESIAGHVAQAAENARLIAASEERLARERALTEATEKVRQRNEIDSILETAAGELARYLNVNRIAVRLSPAAGPSSEIEPAV